MSINQAFISELDYEFVSTRKLLERIPTDKFDWKPHEKSMSMGQLSAHVADMFSWLPTILETDELDFCERLRAAESGDDRRINETVRQKPRGGGREFAEDRGRNFYEKLDAPQRRRSFLYNAENSGFARNGDESHRPSSRAAFGLSADERYSGSRHLRSQRG